MKRLNKVSAVFGAFLMFIGTFFIAPSVFAEGNIFKLVSVNITDKSATSDAEITGGNEDSFSNRVVFSGLGEYVEYTLTIKNTDTNNRRVVRIGVENSNPYLSYLYDGEINDTFAPDDTFDFVLRAVYATEIENASLVNQNFETIIKVTYEDIVTGDEEDEEITAIVVPNTGGSMSEGFGVLAAPAASLLFVAVIIVGAHFINKYKKTAIATMAISAITTVFVLTISVNAASNLDDSITIQNDMTFFYRACTGICYYGNGADEGSMADQAASAGDEAILAAPNFSRDGYGFASWNTAPDGTGTNYGPNQVLVMPASGELKLYANWIESEGEMVGFDCETLQLGEITALNDTDGQTYAVAKLADHNCWTIENSRASITGSINENTESRGDGTDIDSAIYGYGNYYTEDSVRDDEICPTGWRVPSGDVGGDYRNLEEALDPDGTQTVVEQLITWLSYPNNFVLGGFYYQGYGALLGYSSDIILRGNTGYYYGSDALYDHGNSSYNIYATALALPGPLSSSPMFMAGVQMSSGQGAKMPARCVTGDSYAASLTPHDLTLSYDANGGENAPAAQTEEVTGRSYTFTITNDEPTRYHYDFRAWVEEANKNKLVGVDYLYDDEKFYAGDDYEISTDTTLYALWEEKCVNIHYMANDSNAVGEMSVQTVCPPKHNATLIAPNYSLAGHSYIGWNTKADGSGTLYGPNEYVALPAVDDFYLYAQWIEPVTGLTMQTFDGTLPEYVNAPQGTVIALRDERDNEIYAIAKLKDGHWWMTENLRLDLNDPNVVLDATNTNNPTSAFLTEYNENFHGHASGSTIAPCATLGDACEKRISFTTVDTNRNYPASFNDESNMTSWYAYGGHYNWYTATAGHGEPALSTAQTAGDICPSGWRLPTGRTNGGETVALDKLMGGNGANNHDYNIANKWLSSPINVVLAGSYSSDETGSDRGYQGKIWTGSSKEPTSGEQGLTIVLDAFGDAYFGSNGSTTNKWYALSVRCIANY